jgi:NAD(P)-dependent dehydrogenase (short-subunit alcohol dehydrogenase family)
MLAGKIAIVTGAGQGLGRGIVEEMARQDGGQLAWGKRHQTARD